MCLQHRLSTTEDENKRPKSFQIGLRQFHVAPNIFFAARAREIANNFAQLAHRRGLAIARRETIARHYNE
jgi:hypothetical protein